MSKLRKLEESLFTYCVHCDTEVEKQFYNYNDNICYYCFNSDDNHNTVNNEDEDNINNRYIDKKEYQKLIISGQTGSGKTFNAFQRAKELGSFIYIAPCMQLVYESFVKYGTKKDSILTGDLTHQGSNNIFATYEAINEDMLNKYDTLIIDEAHFISDYQRGQHLYNLIQAKNINIFLVTATRNFRKISGYTLIELESKIKFDKQEIDYDEFYERAEKGVPSIYFMATKREDDIIPPTGIKYDFITADTQLLERLMIQKDFLDGKLTFIFCTNVLAQGLNFPCENIYIEDSNYETTELLNQKLGRLGRFGVTNKDSKLTYALDNGLLDVAKKKIKKASKKDITYQKPRYIHKDNSFHLIEMFIEYEGTTTCWYCQNFDNPHQCKCQEDYDDVYDEIKDLSQEDIYRSYKLERLNKLDMNLLQSSSQYAHKLLYNNIKGIKGLRNREVVYSLVNRQMELYEDSWCNFANYMEDANKPDIQSLDFILKWQEEIK